MTDGNMSRCHPVAGREPHRVNRAVPRPIAFPEADTREEAVYPAGRDRGDDVRLYRELTDRGVRRR